MCIDLGRKGIKPEEKDEAEKKFFNAKKVHIIMKQTARQLGVQFAELYDQWGWDLYDQFEHAYIAFRIILSDPDEIFNRIEIEEEHKEALIDVISKRMKVDPLRIRVEF